MKARNVSVYLEVYNEESRLESCLKSFQWATELVVFVKPSNDRTMQIAQELATHVYPVHYTEGNQEFYENFNLHSGKDWCLFITASDLIDPELVEKILAVTDTNDTSAGAFSLNYSLHVLGQSNRASPWFNERKTSLIHRDQLKLSGILHREIGYKDDTKIQNLGSTGDGALHHFTHPTPNSLFEKHRRYTDVEAKQLIEKHGKKSVGIVVKELVKSVLRVTIKQRTIFRGVWGLSLSLVYVSYFIMKLAQVLHHLNYGDDPYIQHKKDILEKWSRTK